MALHKESAARVSTFELRYGDGTEGNSDRALKQAAFLTECANREAVDPDQLIAGALKWATMLVNRGASPAVLNELEAAVRDVEKTVSPRLISRKSRFVWLGQGTAMADPGTLFALVAIEIIELGFVSRIRRCRLKDCRKFFVGDPRSKWCSGTCGSKFRVRLKRKRDRQ